MLQSPGDSLHADRAHVRSHWNRRMQSLRPSLSKTRRGAVGHTLACEDDERLTANIRLPENTDFWILQGKQDTDCRFRFVISGPLFVASRLATRKTF